MTDFKDDEWKMTPSHNIKSVEDFLNDTSSLIDDSSDEGFLNPENSLEDSLSDWGISVPEVISSKNNNSEPSEETEQQERSSILDHLGTGMVQENVEQESEEPSLPSGDDLGYPDEVTGEFELEKSLEEDSERSLFDEVTGTHQWKVESFSEGESLDSIEQAMIQEPEQMPIEESKEEHLLSLDENLDSEAMEVTSVDDPSLPNDNDLEYPDIDAIIKEANSDSEIETIIEEEAPNIIDELENLDNDELEDGKEIKSLLDDISSEDLPEDYKPRSQLTSLEELNNDLNSFTEDTDPSFEITKEIKRNLREEIPSDVEADDFWAIDEFPTISGKLESSGKESTSTSDIKADFFKTSLSDEGEGQFKMKPSSKLASINLSDVSSAPVEAPAQNINIDELVEKVKAALEPQLEAVVKKLFAQKIEQVAWEVIPDLAENVIKKEVEEIAKQVYMSTNELKKE